MSAVKELGFIADELAEELGLEFDGYGSYTGHAALVKHYGGLEKVVDELVWERWQRERGNR